MVWANFGVKISRLGGEVTKRVGEELYLNVKAGVTSFGFAQDRLCTQY
jgi:hypothetical protein